MSRDFELTLFLFVSLNSAVVSRRKFLCGIQMSSTNVFSI
jgi:hypothetical protein